MKSDPARVYVGNLAADITERQLEDAFSPFGRIRNVALKCQQGMYFAFVEFEDSRDAPAAIKARNGFNLRGCIIRVEMPRAAAAQLVKPSAALSTMKHHKPSMPRLLVHGLPDDVHWQELKDTLKQSVPVVFADTKPDGTAIVELSTERDVDRLVELFDGKSFTSKSGSRGVLKVTLENGEPVSKQNIPEYDKWFGFPGCRPGVFA